MLELLKYDPVKHVPDGWVLKRIVENGNPIEGTPDGIRWFNKVEDVTDGASGWIEKGDVSYDESKQQEWKEKTEVVIFKKDSEIIPDFSFDKTRLEFGKSNNDIRYLQIILKHEGYFPVSTKPKGDFDSVTKEAVKNFQMDYGLDDGTGNVGDETIEQLNEILEGNCVKTKSRASVILESANQIHTTFLPQDFPVEIVLGITAIESGTYFDNEYVIDDPNDCGRGIKQITSPGYIGYGSGIKCYNNDCPLCIVNDCKCYYTNTIQGIESNIKDGWKALRDKHNRFTGKNWEEEDINCDGSPITITTSDFEKILAIWAYNGITLDPEKNYLRAVADRLITLESYFGANYEVYLSETLKLSDEDINIWACKLNWANDNRQILSAKLGSPGELRIYDSQGRVTGLVNGEIKSDIPGSEYSDGTFTILFPSDSHRYEVIGTEQGTYGLDINFAGVGYTTSFTATSIPTTPNEVHEYTIDWAALSQGEAGATVQVDSDGDGTFEDTFSEDSSLTQTEFLLATEGIYVESSDVMGGIRDIFAPGESVYVIGGGYAASTTYNLYVVENTTWTDGMVIPARIAGTVTSVITDSSGDIPAGTLIWASSVVGQYDIVVDVNGNSVYDEAVDPLDDMDVNDAGFETVPEFTTIAIPVAAIFGLFVFIRRRKHH